MPTAWNYISVKGIKAYNIEVHWCQSINAYSVEEIWNSFLILASVNERICASWADVIRNSWFAKLQHENKNTSVSDCRSMNWKSLGLTRIIILKFLLSSLLHKLA